MAEKEKQDHPALLWKYLATVIIRSDRPTNNSDPLNITRSNPNLKPTYNQSVRLEAQNTKQGVFATLNWNNRINSQTRAVTYNQQTGGRETYPVNINGNWNMNGVLRYQKRIKSFSLNANAGGSLRKMSASSTKTRPNNRSVVPLTTPG